jgi:hypothetical protein
MKKDHKKTGMCIYCSEQCENLTKDHIFPRTWYPDSTPSTIEKWVVPACNKCNHHYGVIEQELMIRMGLCLDPKSPESGGIPEKALRAINPKHAKSERDRKARQKLRERILQDTNTTKEPLFQGILPNFGPQQGVDYGDHYTTIKIPADLLEELGRKFVRGLTYKLENGLIISSGNSIEMYHAEDTRVREVTDLIERVGYIEYRGPGVRIQRAVANLESVGALFRITMWGKWTIYAVVLPFQSDLATKS